MKKFLCFFLVLWFVNVNASAQNYEETHISTEVLSGIYEDIEVLIIYEIYNSNTGLYTERMYTHVFSGTIASSYTFPYPIIFNFYEFVSKRRMVINIGSYTMESDLHVNNVYNDSIGLIDCTRFDLKGSGNSFIISFGCPVGI